MAGALTGLPEGVALNALSERVYRAMQEHTAFPWAVLSAQCKRLNVDPTALSRESLEKLAPLLAAGVGRFTSPAAQSAVLRTLQSLATS